MFAACALSRRNSCRPPGYQPPWELGAGAGNNGQFYDTIGRTYQAGAPVQILGRADAVVARIVIAQPKNGN
jgi:hypothetical protein